MKDYIEKSEKKNASVIIKLFLASNGIVTIAVDLEYDGQIDELGNQKVGVNITDNNCRIL